MYLTEEEAKNKWCPMCRIMITGEIIVSPGSRAVFKEGDNVCANDGCIASNCMMWRATDNVSTASYPGDFKAKSLPAGYCGLGGKP